MQTASLYAQLNREFFRDRLPVYRVRFRQFDRPGQEGECKPTARTILLATPLKGDPQKLRQVLLHEMCHIGSPGHGLRFQAKLARLAANGESWAEELRRELADR